MLSVIPFAVIETGGSESMAGLSTGIFMAATVATQYFTPRIIRRVGSFPVMAIAGLLLGLPAVAHLFSMDTYVVVAVAIVRGIGFGAVTVTEAALIADLVPLHLLGRSSAIFGGVVGATQLIGFPLGMWIYDRWGSAVFIIAAIYAIVGSIAAFGLPVKAKSEDASARGITEPQAGSKAEAGETESAKGKAPSTYQVRTWRLATVPGLLIGVAAVGFAAFSTFLAPAAADIDVVMATAVSGSTMAVIGASQTVARIFAGWWADRMGEPGKLASLALACALIGVLGAGISITVRPTGLPLVVACLSCAAIFGVGFGLAQSEALLLLFHRLPRDRSADASALWNMSFDSGTGIGAIILGFVASSLAYQGAFMGAGLVIAGGLFIVIVDRVLGKHRISEHNNVRLRLQRLSSRVRVRNHKDG